MLDCPSENVLSRNILSFLKQANPLQLIILESDFIFYRCFSQSIETSQENNEKCKPFLYQEQPISLNSSVQLRLTVCELKLEVSLKEFSNMQRSVCSFKNTYMHII